MAAFSLRDFFWRKEYGGLRIDQTTRLVEPDNMILKVVSRRNFQARPRGTEELTNFYFWLQNIRICF